jgi:site-specific DNA-methyltransferase (adenine-specific)
MRVPESEVFLMDCMEGMKSYPDKHFELAIVDPPYGNNDAIGVKNGNSHNADRKDYKLFKNVAPDTDYFIELQRVSKDQIVWGANFFGLTGGYICWNKNGTAFGEAELAFCSYQNSVSVFEYTWNGMIQGDMKNKEIRVHPTQKPVALYKWLLKNYAKEGDKILDTHLGSGSSRIAAFEMGFDFTGYEIDKDYFEASEKRFQQYKSQLKLFQA